VRRNGSGPAALAAVVVVFLLVFYFTIVQPLARALQGDRSYPDMEGPAPAPIGWPDVSQAPPGERIQALPVPQLPFPLPAPVND
jgi:hypothetical protein